MMLTAIVIATMLAGQTRTLNVPKINYEIPVVGGQREILLGPKPYESIFFAGYFDREVQAKHLATPGNTGDYVDSMIPGGLAEDSLGYFDFVTKSDTLFDKPCMLITTTAKWNQKVGRKPNEIKWQNVAKQQWWLTPDGKIIRHFSTLQTPDGIQSGDCTYGKDSIQRRYTDIHGKTSFGEIFPVCGMDAINARFTPMIVDGKVVMREKEFFSVDPLTGGIAKYTVHSSGTFRGELLQATFKGKTFDMDGPNFFHQKLFLDDTGDLVKVALSEEKYFVISSLPRSHTDEYGHPIRKSGGG